jgi:hypothetical protein
MLNEKEYQEHFPDDPAYTAPPGPARVRAPYSAALLEALAALEDEFRTILRQTATSGE